MIIMINIDNDDDNTFPLYQWRLGNTDFMMII